MSDFRRCANCSTHLYGTDAFCPRCGSPAAAPASVPAIAPSGRRLWPWVAAGVAAVVVVVALLGVQTGLLPRGTMDGASVEASVEEHFEGVLDGQVSVTCPETIWQQKGRITDCSAEFPSGRTAAVYVEQIDSGGHYRFQAEGAPLAAEIRTKIDQDAAELQEQIERDTEQAVADLPRMTFVQTCATSYNQAACGCAWNALPAADRDTVLVELLALQPSDRTLAVLEGCGAPTD